MGQSDTQIMATRRRTSSATTQLSCRVEKNDSPERIAIFQSELNIFPIPSPNQPSIAIIDEASELETDSGLSELMTEIRRKGYQKLLIIATGSSDELVTNTTALIQRVLVTQEKSSSVYRLEKKTLTPQLAREYLNIIGAQQEVIDFIIKVFPLYPNILALIGYKDSIDSVKRWWRRNEQTFARYQRGIDKKDIELINSRLNE